MLSCGMNDYSGEFAFKYGFPATVTGNGGMMIVIPGLCGIGLFSKGVKLDTDGISGGMKSFCGGLNEKFNCHHLEDAEDDKMDEETDDQAVIKLLFSAQLGNIEGIRRYWLKDGFDMNVADYRWVPGLEISA